MSWDYGCPTCGATLNPRETIVLVGEREGVRTLMGFHPQPGNYDIYVPSEVTVAAGARWSFSCPVCQASLAIAGDDDLCAIDVRTGEGGARVVFSRVAGEHATFVVTEEGIEAHYGPDAPRHLEKVLSERFIVHPI